MDLNEALYRTTPSDYGEERYQNHLLEQYKLNVQMANKISERRQSANSFFLTVNTALIAFLGLAVTPDVGSNPSITSNPPLPWVLVVSRPGWCCATPGSGWYARTRISTAPSSRSSTPSRAGYQRRPTTPPSQSNNVLQPYCNQTRTELNRGEKSVATKWRKRHK
jgi:hypothetical protein